MKGCVAGLFLLLAACTPAPVKPPVRTVVILGNKTTSAACTCPDVAIEKARADDWKAYAEKLETRLGLPHRGVPQP